MALPPYRRRFILTISSLSSRSSPYPLDVLSNPRLVPVTPHSAENTVPAGSGHTFVLLVCIRSSKRNERQILIADPRWRAPDDTLPMPHAVESTRVRSSLFPSQVSTFTTMSLTEFPSFYIPYPVAGRQHPSPILCDWRSQPPRDSRVLLTKNGPPETLNLRAVQSSEGDIDPTRDNVCGVRVPSHTPLSQADSVPCTLDHCSIGSVIHRTTSRKHISQDKTDSYEVPHQKPTPTPVWPAPAPAPIPANLAIKIYSHHHAALGMVVDSDVVDHA